MPDPSAQTASLCPHCLSRIEARKITEENSVFLLKTCPVHGSLEKVLLWHNSPFAYEEWRKGDDRTINIQTNTSAECPSNCGLCPNHKQSTCTAIIEVTHRCNLHCPVCFAASPDDRAQNPSRQQITAMLQAILDRSGPCPVQFSGGEPTLRDDLPEITALARGMGFDHIQVNTNGIRLAQDAQYADALREAGVTVIFLQFDGLTDDVYLRIRGSSLSALKQKAVRACTESELGVILVPTLVRGVNENQIGPIIQYAKDNIPTVKGVHFQPMTFLGRYSEEPGNERRILISDILTAIEDQTGGELKAEYFVPPGCEESHCSFSSFTFLDKAGNLVPTTRFSLSREMGSGCSKDPAEQSISSVRSRWKYRRSELPVVEAPGSTQSVHGDETYNNSFLDRVRNHSLCISGMAFQDAWNIDLERLQRCCVHVVTPDARMIPFCAYYMTGSKGQRLYKYPSENV